MSQYLITQSLVSAWNYMHECREECQEEAYADFLNTLNRIPKETTREMQNGIDFENLVYSIANGTFRLLEYPADETMRIRGDTILSEKPRYPKWYNGAMAVADRIMGAPVQVKAYRGITVPHYGDLLLYGVLDALRAGTIYDVKFSNKSFGSAELAGKYLNSPQHPAYLYLIPEARNFIYLVSDGEDLYTEEYTRENTRPFEDIAGEFLASLDAMNLLGVYREKWAAR